MSTTQRVVRKQLAGAEDLLQGVGTVTQTRGSWSYPIHKLDIPIPTYNIAEMQASSAEFMRLYGTDTAYTDYRRNPEGTIGIPSNLGGVWEPMRSSEYLVCGNFATGAYVFSSDCIVALDQQLYNWQGSVPKVVAAGATPASTGGVGAGAWVDRTDVTLRSEINIIQKRFACVADMVADESLSVGSDIETVAYHAGWAAESHAPIGGGKYVLLSLSDAKSIRGDTWNPDGVEDFYSAKGTGSEYVLLHLRDVQSVLALSSFGASRYRSQAENSNAINAAWTALSFEGAGTIVFEDLYDIGSNSIVLTLKNSMTSRSPYSLVGKNSLWADQQGTISSNSGFGIKSTASSIIQWGDGSSDMTGRGLLKDLAIYSMTTNQIGLDFANTFGSSNISCDLDNVRLIDFEGDSSYIINQGRCVDSVWSNIKLFGKGTQPYAGIKVTRELPTLISPQINYCRRSLWVTAASNAFFNILGGWSIQPAIAHIAFQGGSVTHLMTSSAHGFAMLETTASTSTPVLCETSSGCTAFLSLSGCQMDSSTSSASGRAIDFQCGGRLKMDNCKLNPGSTARNIKLGSYTVFTVLNCEGFTMEDATFSQITAIDSGITALGSSVGFTGTNTVPTTTKNGYSYLDNGTNTARKRAGWRFYDSGSATFLDMHPQFESKNTLTGTPNAWVKTYMPDGTPIWLHATTTAPA